MMLMMLGPLASIINIIGGSFLQGGVALPALPAAWRSPLNKALLRPLSGSPSEG